MQHVNKVTVDGYYLCQRQIKKLIIDVAAHGDYGRDRFQTLKQTEIADVAGMNDRSTSCKASVTESRKSP